MGEELKKSFFSNEDERVFRQRALEETAFLCKGIDQAKGFQGRFGFELEGCLTYPDGTVAPSNQDFLSRTQNDAFVPEIAKFDFEVNSRIFDRTPKLFSEFQTELDQFINHSRKICKDIGGIHPVWVGIAPSITPENTTLHFMTPSNRYAALAERAVLFRNGRPTHIAIDRRDSISFDHPDVMLEASATSVQFHIEVPIGKAAAIYNLLQAISGPLVALGANSPFLFGKKLWDETRIAAFEQSMRFRGVASEDILDPVTFGREWVRSSLGEIFEDNLKFPVLLPMVFDSKKRDLRHLKLLNGQVWRWNRPIITPGPSDDHPVDSVRIEFRPLPAGPSSVDMTAQFALLLGLVLWLGPKGSVLNSREWAEEKFGAFGLSKENFYSCAKLGLKADINWQGRHINVQRLLHDILIPEAKKALLSGDWSTLSEGDLPLQHTLQKDEIDYYFDEVLLPTARTGWNGAAWQKSWVDLHGPNFKEMTQEYRKRQELGNPVHAWKV